MRRNDAFMSSRGYPQGINTVLNPRKASFFYRIGLQPIVFLSCWVFLFLIDSPFGYFVPGAMKLRILFPGIALLLLLNVLLSGNVQRFRGAAWFVGFIVAAVFSSLISVAPFLALNKLWMVAAVIGWGAFSVQLARRFVEDAESFKVLVLLFCGVLAISALLIPLGGAFRNANALGVFPLCAFPVLLIGRDKKLFHFGDMFWMPLILLSIALVIGSYSRTSFFAMFVFFAVYYGCRWGGALTHVLVVMALLFASMVVAVNLELGAEKIIYKDDAGDLLDDARENMFRETYEAFVERPIFGYGFGLSWRLRPEDVEAVYRFGRLSWYVGEFGNTTLALLGGGGLVVCLMFYCFLGSIIYEGFLALKRLSRNDQYVLTCLLSGVCALAVHSQGEAWMMSPFNWITPVFWLYCGMIIFLASRAYVTNRTRMGAHA